MHWADPRADPRLSRAPRRRAISHASTVRCVRVGDPAGSRGGLPYRAGTQSASPTIVAATQPARAMP